MNTPKIYVLYTGGTIGMRHGPDGLEPDTGLGDWLTTLIAGTDYEGRVVMLTLDPLIDSSNATPATWQRIIDEILAHQSDAAGFVVLHGTDTMAYTASALSYALSELEAPVVITGSQRPLADFGSDGIGNVMGALQAVIEPRLRGVYLFFGQHLFIGNRTTKISAWHTEAFSSPATPAVAETGGNWRWNKPFLNSLATEAHSVRAALGVTEIAPYKAGDVVVIHLVPGLSATRLESMLTPLPQAAIIRGYGTGNVPSDEPGFLDVLESAAQRGCILIATTQTVQALVQLETYATGSRLEKIGVLSSSDSTLEALYTKVTFLLSQPISHERVRELLKSPLVGEISLN